MQVKALIAQTAIKGFDQPVFYRSTGPNKVQLHLVAVGPGVNCARAKLGAVVHRDRFWVAPQFRYSFQALDHAGSRHVMGYLQLEALARKLVDHGQSAEVTAALQTVRHKVHRPALVRLSGSFNWPAIGTGQPAPLLAAHLQAKLPVKPVNQLLAHGPSFAFEQDR